jgi:hypothetical protein
MYASKVFWQLNVVQHCGSGCGYAVNLLMQVKGERRSCILGVTCQPHAMESHHSALAAAADDSQSQTVAVHQRQNCADHTAGDGRVKKYPAIIPMFCNITEQDSAVLCCPLVRL